MKTKRVRREAVCSLAVRRVLSGKIPLPMPTSPGQKKNSWFVKFASRRDYKPPRVALALPLQNIKSLSMKLKLLRAFPLLVLLAGCNARGPAATPPPASNVAVQGAQFPTDDLDRPVNLAAPAKRVIVIGPGAIETMFAIGADKQLVGRDNYAAVPAAAKDVAIAGDFQGPNVEQAVALRPDLIIVQGETYDRARVENWQSKIGAPVAVLTPHTLKMVREDIYKMGQWTGKTAKSQKVAATLNLPAPPKNGRKAFIEIGSSPLYSAGPDTLVGNIIEAAGFTNVAQIKGYQPYNIESLLANPPDVYLATSDKPKAQIVAELRKSPTLSKLDCIRKGRVIVVEGDLILRPGPRLKQGIEKLREQQKN